LHILFSLHPTVSLAELVKEIKTSTSRWIKAEGVFPSFTHWQDGYGAFTVSYADCQAVIEYIKGQPEHHRKTPFQEELRNLLTKYGVSFDEKYLA
jgi:REP element-mobilizing transposase RayT